MKNAFNISLKAIKVAGIEFAGNIEIAVNQVDDQYHAEFNLDVNKVKAGTIDLEMDLQMSMSSDFTKGEYLESIDSFVGRCVGDSDPLTSLKELEDKNGIQLPNIRKALEDPSKLVESLEGVLSPIFEVLSGSDDDDTDIDSEASDDPNLEDTPSDNDEPRVIKVYINPWFTDDCTDVIGWDKMLILPSNDEAMKDILWHARYTLQPDDVRGVGIRFSDGSLVEISTRYLTENGRDVTGMGKRSKLRSTARRVNDCFIGVNNGMLGHYKQYEHIELQ